MHRTKKKKAIGRLKGKTKKEKYFQEDGHYSFVERYHPHS